MVRIENKLKILVILMVVAIATTAQLITAEAVDYTPVLRVITDDVYLTAGIENQIKIILTNVGSWNIYEAKIALSVPASTPGISIVDGGHRVYNLIGEDESKMFYASVYVDENTPLGAYSLTLQATYMKKVQYGIDMLESTTLQLGIVVNKISLPNIRMSAEAESPLLTAGADNLFKIALKNIGDIPLYDIDATIASVSPYIVILEGARFTSAELEVNQTVLHPITLRVSGNTPLGGYTLTENVIYEDKDGQIHAETFLVGVNVHNSSRPILKVAFEEPHLTAGIENGITVKLTNIGDQGLGNIDVSLISASPYMVVMDGGQINFDGLGVGESVSFDAVFAVSRSAPVGVYTVTASTHYSSLDGNERLENLNLGVSVDSVDVPEKTFMVMRSYGTSIEPVSPGDRFQLILDLECLGAKANDIKSSLSIDPMIGISTLSPTLVSIGDLEPDQEAEAEYDLLIGGSVRAGQYPAVVTVSYLDADGVPGSLVETVTLSVRGRVDFKLINEEPTRVPLDGSTEFEADLLLIGTESVKFVSIELVEDQVFKRISGSEEYIGAVDPDSPIPFDVWFRVAGGTDIGDYVLKLKVYYTDDLYQEHEETIDVSLTVIEATENESQSASAGGFWAWLRRLLGLGP